MIVKRFTYYSSLRRVRMKAQWLARRSGSLPWSLTSIQLSVFNSEIRQLQLKFITKNVMAKIDAIKRQKDYLNWTQLSYIDHIATLSLLVR